MIKQIELPFDLELPLAQTLKAGSLSCMYEAGNLRYISLGQTELVRKIYGAIRNENWVTQPYKIQDEKITISESGFLITYTAIYGDDSDLYRADFTIEGKMNNTISFSMKGIALSDFKRNRIGLCLHHPLKECIGRMVVVTSRDSTVYHSTFPELVSPTLPFMEMQQLKWTTENNLTVDIHFEGDVFETEDQRNWSDGSFKTYSTRSSMPRPVNIKAGDTIEQKIIVKISGVTEATAAPTTGEIQEVKVPFPQVGYCRSDNNPGSVEEMIEWLIKIPFDHYRVSITMNENNWQPQLQQYLDEAGNINTRLELVVFFSDDYKNEIKELITKIDKKQLLVKSILLLQKDHNVTPPELLRYLYPIINIALPAVKIGYGTDVIFVDVNQDRPPEANFDFISFGIQPQAHAFDNRSILENLQSQPFIMKTAMEISGGKPVCISPVTLKDRNAGTDERQHSSMLALWTMICLQNCSEAYSITFYELFGGKGMLFSEEDKDGAVITKTSPLYQALATIFDFQPVWIVKRFVDEELLMDGLLLESEKGERLFFKVPTEYQFFKESSAL